MTMSRTAKGKFKKFPMITIWSLYKEREQKKKKYLHDKTHFPYYSKKSTLARIHIALVEGVHQETSAGDATPLTVCSQLTKTGCF